MFHHDQAKDTPRDGRAWFLSKSLALESHSEVSLLKTSEGKKRIREVERMVRKKKKKIPNNQLDIALPVSSYDLTVSTPSTDVTEDKRGSELGLFHCSSSTESLPFLSAIPFLQLTTKQLSKI